MMVDNALDRPLLLKVPDRTPCKATVDFESLDEDTLGDESESWRFLEYTVIGDLVEGNSVLRLVLNFSF